MKNTAVIIGATGAVGKVIVRFATENKGEGTYTYNDF